MGLLARFQQVASSDLSKNTLDTYTCWVRKFHRFTKKRASEWEPADITRFIHSMQGEGYALKSRHQALCALVYVFKRVLKVEIGNLDLPKVARPKPTLKILPTRPELARIFAGLHGQPRLMAALMYGSGLRVSECCQLRMKDIDFSEPSISVYDGKGGKNRRIVLPIRLVPALQKYMAWRSALHANDLDNGDGYVQLPGRLAQKYRNANRELPWQYLFPSEIIREHNRWHTTPERLQNALRKAVRSAGILKRVTPHTLRHAFATHALQTPGNDIKMVQELLGHDSIETTAIYLHADQAAGTSPLDYHVPARIKGPDLHFIE